jgi:hypothetical protein
LSANWGDLKKTFKSWVLLIKMWGFVKNMTFANGLFISRLREKTDFSANLSANCLLIGGL